MGTYDARSHSILRDRCPYFAQSSVWTQLQLQYQKVEVEVELQYGISQIRNTVESQNDRNRGRTSRFFSAENLVRGVKFAGTQKRGGDVITLSKFVCRITEQKNVLSPWVVVV